MSANFISGASPAHSLQDLAANIVKQTTDITAYLKANDLPEPTFKPDSIELPDSTEYLILHSSLVSSLEDLRRLVNGPRRSMRSFICQGNDLAAFQVAFEFDFFSIVPLETSISIHDLAENAGIDVDRASRIMRMMVTHRVFWEERPGLDEMWKAATASAACIKAFPYESDSAHAPFTTAMGVPLFTYYEMNPNHATRFAKAMAGSTNFDRQIKELRDKFDWGKLKGTVVDVGGGSGHVSIALAHNFPDLDFVVQDVSAGMLAEGKRLDTAGISGRVSFVQHDFFEPQPRRRVAAFFIRQCTHNWCDRDVISIFKALVPGLEGSDPGTPLLINDTILPEPGVRPAHEERGLRQIDMLMMIALGAKQRTRVEFESLLKEADSRYEIRSVHADGSMGLLEVQLK